MPIDFDDLKLWRDAAPPETLKPRIAAALAPRPSFRLKPALAALAACAAAVSVFLLFPGSPARPLPAFADVEKAMANVKYVSWKSSQTLHGPMAKTFGELSNHQSQTWLRREPPAIVTQTKDGGRTLWDARGMLKYKQHDGEFIIYDKNRGYGPNPDPAREIARSVEQTLHSLTQPSQESRARAMGMIATGGKREAATLDGRRVWRFVWNYQPDWNRAPWLSVRQRIRKQGGKWPPSPLHDIERYTVWADVKTLRVRATELYMTFDGNIQKFTQNTFDYDDTPPTNIFNASRHRRTRQERHPRKRRQLS